MEELGIENLFFNQIFESYKYLILFQTLRMIINKYKFNLYLNMHLYPLNNIQVDFSNHCKKIYTN